MLERDHLAAAQGEYEDEWEDFVSQLDIPEAEKRRVKEMIVMHEAHNLELVRQWLDGQISAEAYYAARLRDADLEEALDRFLAIDQLDRFQDNLQRIGDEFEEKMITSRRLARCRSTRSAWAFLAERGPPGAQTALMIVAGIEGGQAIGASDEWGYKAQEQPISPHDMHATILHPLGLDHERLTYRYSDRDYRLSDIDGKPIPQIIA